MIFDNILIKEIGEITEIVIDRPEDNNKLSISCMNELVAAFQTAQTNPKCRVVILSGNGEYFCAGGALGDFRAKGVSQIREFGESFINLHTTLTGLSKPVIAAVTGDALGGGFNLVEACDLAVAADGVMFSVPEIKSGIAPMMALTGVSRIFSRKRVMELALLGEKITADRACEIGLVNWVCPKKEVMETAFKIARQLTGNNPMAISLCKKLYQDIDGLNYKRQLESGLNMLVFLLKSDETAGFLRAKEVNG